MVAVGLLTQSATTVPEGPALVAGAPLAEPAGEEPSRQAVTPQEPRLDLAEFAVLNEAETEVVEPNRASCEAIRGTVYANESERAWFLANCVEAEPIVALLARPELSGAVLQPETTTSSGPVEMSEGEAIASSIDWITSQPDAVYDVDSESCSASEVGALWLVSCERSLAGCGYEICTSWVSVCVTDAEGAVLSSRNC